jgi:hypothetical protein
MRAVLLTLISLLGMLGVPLSHSAGAATAGVAVSFAFLDLSLRVLLNGLGTKMAVYPGGLDIESLPPNTLVSVAFLLWPVAG